MGVKNRQSRKRVTKVKNASKLVKSDAHLETPPSSLDKDEKSNHAKRLEFEDGSSSDDDEKQGSECDVTSASEAMKASTPQVGPSSLIATESGEAGSEVASMKKPRKRRSRLSLSIYAHKILKQVHPDLSITKVAMEVVDDMLMDTMKKLVREASHLVSINGHKTMTARDIETAVKLLLPGELSRHATAEGNKALVKYMANV